MLSKRVCGVRRSLPREVARAIAAILFMVSAVYLPRAEAQQFYDMGSLNGVASTPNDISADGSTVVGWSTSAAPKDHEAVVWTREGGLVLLPAPPEALSPEYEAAAISADGTTIVGHAGVSGSPVPTPIVWRNQVPSALPVPAGLSYGRAYDVNGDGTRIVGYAQNEDAMSVLWTHDVPSALNHSVPGQLWPVDTISRDGGTYLYRFNTSGGSVYRCDGSICTALHPPAGMQTSILGGVSADGAVVAGNVYAAGSNQSTNIPARWFEGADAAQVLGPLGPGKLTRVNGISADGNTLYGSTLPGSGGVHDLEAWRWSVADGYQLISDILINEGLGQQIASWELVEAIGASDDGKVIIGFGFNPSGKRRGWIADLRRVPPNDTCEHPIFIGEGLIPNYDERQTTGTTEDAAGDGASTCTFGDGPDVWYEFSSPQRGYLKLELCGSELVNPVISVHLGCPGGSFNQLYCANDCDDAACDGVCIDRPWIPIEPGETYLIRVAGENGYSGGLFTLVSQFVPHADECADAALVMVPSTTPGITTLASVSPVSQCDTSPVTAPGVWYRVIGTGATMTASMCGAADYDTKLSLYCGGCESPTCLTQSDDACGLQSEISWCSAPGQQYYLLVHGYETFAGSFELSVSSSGPACGFTWTCSPDNDECSGALPLMEGTTLVDNGAAQTDPGQTSCGGVGNDLWHAYVPTCSGSVLIDTCQANFGTLDDTVLSVLDACSGNELSCNGDYVDSQVDCGFRSAVEVATTAGSEILIRSGGYPTIQQTGTYPLRVTEIPAVVTVPDTIIATLAGEFIDVDLGISGGCPPFMSEQGNGYFVSTEGLPPGLSVDSFGYLSGTPPYSGQYTATVDVGDREITTPGDSATLDIIITAPNDACADALPIGEGSVLFGNHGLTTDGPSESDACIAAGITQIDRDLWYLYQSSCDGIATIDLCESELDATLAIYDGPECPTEPGALLCEHQACGATPRSTIPVTAGAEYLIRVGGFAGAEGNGVLTITCYNDCNDNGISDSIEVENLGLPSYSFHAVDFSAHHNANMQADLDGAFPVGEVSLGGVPFVIPDQGTNYWHSVTATGANPRYIDVPIARYGVAEVHTLINTYWGQTGPASYASIEFFGSEGAYHLKELVGNEDIRDFNEWVFTNMINHTTTTNVVSLGHHRLDKQRIALPADFQDETLTTIRVSDYGGNGIQRVFLAGVTALVENRSSDCNGNRQPDDCELPGDANGDGEFTIADWASLRACGTAPCTVSGCAPAAYSDTCCARFDYENDGDVDLKDLGEWTRQYSE